MFNIKNIGFLFFCYLLGACQEGWDFEEVVYTPIVAVENFNIACLSDTAIILSINLQNKGNCEVDTVQATITPSSAVINEGNSFTETIIGDVNGLRKDLAIPVSGDRSAGEYTMDISLLYHDGFKTDTTISVQLEELLQAEFSMDEGCQAPCSIQFDASLSTGGIQEYIWDFGDGKMINGDEKMSFDYTLSDTLTVTLIVRSNCSEDTISKQLVISASKLATTFGSPFGDSGYGHDIYFNNNEIWVPARLLFPGGLSGESSFSIFQIDNTFSPFEFITDNSYIIGQVFDVSYSPQIKRFTIAQQFGSSRKLDAFDLIGADNILEYNDGVEINGANFIFPFKDENKFLVSGVENNRPFINEVEPFEIIGGDPLSEFIDPNYTRTKILWSGNTLDPIFFLFTGQANCTLRFYQYENIFDLSPSSDNISLEYFGDAILTSNNEIYLVGGKCGSPETIVLLKLLGNGIPVTITEFDFNYDFDENYGFDISLTETNNGHHVVLAAPNNSGGDTDVYLAKVEKASETLIWETFIDSGSQRNDFPYKIKQAPDGGYVITGYSVEGQDVLTRILFIKTDPWGNIN